MAEDRLALLSRLNEYLRVTQGENAARLGGPYTSFVEMLETLNNLTTEYYRKNEDGEYKSLNADDVKRLRECYSAVVVAADQLLDRKKPNKAEKRYNVVVSQIRNLLVQDAEVIYNISADAGHSLPEMVWRARTPKVALETQNVLTVGENSSRRIPLKFTDINGNERKGFFSEIHTLEFDSAKVSKKYVEDRLKAHDTDGWPYSDVFKAILDRNVFGYDLIIDLTAEDPNRPGEYSNFLRKLGLSEARINELAKNDGLNKEINALQDLAVKTERNQFSYESGTPGSGIESRNNAFSAVAEAFGVSSLVAKSEGMELTLNGETIHGSFMATASGSDCHRPTENDPMVKWANNGLDKAGSTSYKNKGLKVSANAMRQLADMDVLDYICGNRDRHSGNLLYQFDTSDPENPVLSGVTGIDNDRSFLVSAPDKKTPNITHLEDIRFVSQSMAERILGMTKAQLSLRLADKQLSEAEINAAFGRVEEMQNRILNGAKEFSPEDDLYAKKDGAVRVLSDEQFAQLDYNRLVGDTPDVKTLFGRTFDGAKSALNHHAKLLAKENGFKKNAIEYNKATTFAVRTDSVKGLGDRLDGFRSDLINNDHFYLINSSKFNDMKESLYNLIKAVDEGFEDESKLETLYSDLGEKCQTYINAKGNLPDTEYGRNRLEAARQIRDYVNDRIAELHDPMAQSLKQTDRFIVEVRQKAVMAGKAATDRANAQRNYDLAFDKKSALGVLNATTMADEMYVGLLKQNVSGLFIELQMQENFKQTFDPTCFSQEKRDELKSTIEDGQFLDEYCSHLKTRPGVEKMTSEEFFKDITDAKAKYAARHAFSDVAPEEEKEVNVSVLELDL